MKNKVIIIGGGLGGLFTGAILAKEGVEVEVLEKNGTIGGGLQTFSRGGVSFETGMHLLGGFRPGGNIYRICDYIGILDDLAVRHVDDDCIDEIHYLADGATYNIARGPEGFVDSLAARFPAERQGLSDYVAHLYRIANRVDLFYLRPSSDSVTAHGDDFFMAADELIAMYVRDPRLRDILGYMNPMYAGVRGHTPAYIHALINVLYINGPSRFIDGGMQLADALKRVITRAGGRVSHSTTVVGIDVDESRNITGVVDSKGEHHAASRYISAIHPCALLDMLPAGALPKAYTSRLRSIPLTYSAFSLFIKLKERRFSYINHTCYCQDDYGCVWDYGAASHARWPRGFMYMTPPHSADASPYAGTLIAVSPMGWDVVRQWENTTHATRTPEYEMWKKCMAGRLIDKLSMLYPGFDGMIDTIHTASPLTIRDYYATPFGALYGFRKDCHDIMLSQIPPVTKIRNLILTGQNINLHGICGVPLTAVTTAEIILGRNYIINKINDKTRL